MKKADSMRIISSMDLVEKVSVTHSYTENCAFQTGEQTFVVEREAISKEAFIFSHDFSNKLYLLNPFYLGESYKYISNMD